MAVNTQTFTVPGASVWNAPCPLANIISVRVLALGAGTGGDSGGIGNDTIGHSIPGNGGRGGAWVDVTYSVPATVGVTQPVNVGTGSVGGAAVGPTINPVLVSGLPAAAVADATSFGTLVQCTGPNGSFNGAGGVGAEEDGALGGSTHFGGSNPPGVGVNAGSGGAAGGGSDNDAPFWNGDVGGGVGGGLGGQSFMVAAPPNPSVGGPGLGGGFKAGGGGGGFSGTTSASGGGFGAAAVAGKGGDGGTGAGGGGGGSSVVQASGTSTAKSGAGGRGGDGWLQVITTYTAVGLTLAGYIPLTLIPLIGVVNHARPISLTGRYKA